MQAGSNYGIQLQVFKSKYRSQGLLRGSDLRSCTYLREQHRQARLFPNPTTIANLPQFISLAYMCRSSQRCEPRRRRRGIRRHAPASPIAPRILTLLGATPQSPTRAASSHLLLPAFTAWTPPCAPASPLPTKSPTSRTLSNRPSPRAVAASVTSRTVCAQRSQNTAASQRASTTQGSR
ncbi:uncharacterized protein SCHCODRAFT_02244637 [Schizophyllum commune H4-8]|uniref:uncharacterized protein n=1 Tax=Schizophyllum commune (strain H4-8 / FGSC 9210) TaxID=578458 RepID=UPI00215E3F73|nr:uncharacterized protein SCHCODRAFT_02244637 [Schizophyllum commune H4-8]KAI5893074.1 hypothetical protein SCHCODRAFT_02244637 [Schizophyllum commune H4-8]